MNIEYKWLTGNFVLTQKDLLHQCSVLYSEHYGIWGENGANPGKNVKLSEEKLREWFENEYVSLYYAICENRIVGYAIAFSKNEPSYGTVTWVTQLVVHKDYRNKGIAKNLLFTIWGFSDHYAWGIVSANPYAIRALEKATRRRATPIRIHKNAVKLKNVGIKNVPFINSRTVFDISNNRSLVDTQFFVDHSDTAQKITNVTRDGVPWLLGPLPEGWEWFAFTFKDQEQISLTKEEIENMVATSDSVVHNAYSRMILNTSRQSWMKNTIQEVDYIDRLIGLDNIDFAYDLGCGNARHAIELANRGINVIGIDYVEENIIAAKETIRTKGLTNIQILNDDCRTYKNERKAQLVLCLYDVVGTYASNLENKEIIQNVYNLLKPNGYAIFSVMNYETTAAHAKHFFIFRNEPNKLLELQSSSIMEETGNVYDPDYYIVDSETHIIYRREQFKSGNKLPVELIVRDKRFTKEEIVSLCRTVGFSIVEAKYTNASGWENEYSPDDKQAKEILIVCKKEELL